MLQAFTKISFGGAEKGQCGHFCFASNQVYVVVVMYTLIFSSNVHGFTSQHVKAKSTYNNELFRILTQT